jgi:hypothetical protein
MLRETYALWKRMLWKRILLTDSVNPAFTIKSFSQDTDWRKSDKGKKNNLKTFVKKNPLKTKCGLNKDLREKKIFKDISAFKFWDILGSTKREKAEADLSTFCSYAFGRFNSLITN